MSGEYSTKSREFELPAHNVKYGDLGYAPAKDVDVTYPVQTPSQTTYSWRTKRQSTDDPYQISEDDLRTTRNGFTTYDPKWDNGHEFWTTRTSVSGMTPDVYIKRYYPRYNVTSYWRGPLIPEMPSTPYLQGYPSRERAGDSYTVATGQRAINATAPTGPQANVATAIGEMTRDGLPSMLGMAAYRSKGNLARAAGSEYLNVQFGWLPLIADLRKVVKSLKKAHKTVAQLQRDNGRVVRRRIAFEADVTSSESVYNGYQNPYQDSSLEHFIASGQAQVHVMNRTERSAWFSGAYSYSIPTDNSLMERLSRYDTMANVILGSRLTPETLWELAPWSWLVDWQFGIGTALSAATRMSEDSLVIRYGYLMVKTTRDTMYSVGSTTTVDGQTLPACHLNLRSEVKERVRATPYGFGLNTAGFSLDKIKILGALGLSRTPGVGFKPYTP